MQIPDDVSAAALRLREDLYWGSTEERHRDLCEDALLLANFVADADNHKESA